MNEDTDLLDWLEMQAADGFVWVARRRTTMPGFALHQTTRTEKGDAIGATAREAIRAAMAKVAQ